MTDKHDRSSDYPLQLAINLEGVGWVTGVMVSPIRSVVIRTYGCFLWLSICAAHSNTVLECFQSQICLVDIKLTSTTLHSTHKESTISNSFQNYQWQNILLKPQSTQEIFLFHQHIDETSKALSQSKHMQQTQEVCNQLTHLAINLASMTHNHSKVRYQNMYQIDRL